MNNDVSMKSNPASSDLTSTSKTLVRMNGVMPDISTLGNSEKSERAAEVKRVNITANTSCSVLVSYGTTSSNKQVFHLLVDVGEGIIQSLEKTDLSSYPDFSSTTTKSSIGTAANIPDAILLTHSHNDHVKELPLVISKYSDQESKKLNVYCTKECHDQVIDKFPELKSKINGNGRIAFNMILPNGAFNTGPISVIPISVYHGDPAAGSVIYILRLPEKKKVIVGWDFLSLPDNADQNLFWNPDLVILGTQTYNAHPETGLISVSDAFEFVRRWNAKECYIVHYGGLTDFEDAKNQWFRGPTKAMNSEELQKTINENLRLTGKEGRFKITVAKEGMIWTGEEKQGEVEKWQEQQSGQVSPIGNVIEIESLQDYIMAFEKDNKKDMLKLVIEDRINRYDLKFINPHVEKTNSNMLYAKGEKGMFASGPELKLEILTSESMEREETSIVRINVSKGKKTVFKDDITISRKDTDDLRRYIQENFQVRIL
jgi:phosphoribosyl 1,2-cyclic phosphodiesterase